MRPLGTAEPGARVAGEDLSARRASNARDGRVIASVRPPTFSPTFTPPEEASARVILKVKRRSRVLDGSI
jgi:hypothetical protein